jgi:hypothetical protein
METSKATGVMRLSPGCEVHPLELWLPNAGAETAVGTATAADFKRLADFKRWIGQRASRLGPGSFARRRDASEAAAPGMSWWAAVGRSLVVLLRAIRRFRLHNLGRKRRRPGRLGPPLTSRRPRSGLWPLGCGPWAVGWAVALGARLGPVISSHNQLDGPMTSTHAPGL